MKEATVMHPRFKMKMESEAIWDRLRTAAMRMAATGAEEVFDTHLQFYCDPSSYMHGTHTFLFLKAFGTRRHT